MIVERMSLKPFGPLTLSLKIYTEIWANVSQHTACSLHFQTQVILLVLWLAVDK